MATTDVPLYVTSAHLLLATVSLAADAWEVGEIQPLEPGPAPGDAEPVACPMGCGDVT